MQNYTIVPGRGAVRIDQDFSAGDRLKYKGEFGEFGPPRRSSAYERTRAEVYATGNKWAIENFHATHD